MHCAYVNVMEPVSQFQKVHVDTVVQSIADKLFISRGMSVHLSTDENIIVLLTYHRNALLAINLGEKEEMT